MGVYVADQTLVFLKAGAVGMLLGLFFDVLRISRLAVWTPRPLLFAEDFLFFAAAAVVTFLFQLQATDGMLRMFLFIGELLGAVLYFSAFSGFVMGFSIRIINVFKAVGRFIYRRMLLPIWKLFYQIAVLLMQPFLFLGRITKKVLQNAKFRLKVYRKVLYNQLVNKKSSIKENKQKGAKRKCKKTKQKKA